MINRPPFLRNEPLISLVQGVLDEVFGLVMRQCSAFVYNKYISQVEATNKSEFH